MFHPLLYSTGRFFILLCVIQVNVSCVNGFKCVIYLNFFPQCTAPHATQYHNPKARLLRTCCTKYLFRFLPRNKTCASRSRAVQFMLRKLVLCGWIPLVTQTKVHLGRAENGKRKVATSSLTKCLSKQRRSDNELPLPIVRKPSCTRIIYRSGLVCQVLHEQSSCCHLCLKKSVSCIDAASC